MFATNTAAGPDQAFDDISVDDHPARDASAMASFIRDMSVANPLWGAPRIHGELLKLGIDVGQTTVPVENFVQLRIGANLGVLLHQYCRVCFFWYTQPTEVSNFAQTQLDRRA